MGKKKKQEKLKKQKEKLKKQENPEKRVKKAAKPEKEKSRKKGAKAENSEKPEKSGKRASQEKAGKPAARQAALGREEKSGRRDAADSVRKPAVGQTPKTRRGWASSDRNRAAAARFRALGDENRLRILELLEERELCAADILSSMSIVQSTLSHHMKILTESGLVNVRKQGKWSYYSLDREVHGRLTELIGQWTWTADDKR